MISRLRKFWLLVPIATLAIVCAENIEPHSFIRKRGRYTFDAAGSSIEVITARDSKPSIALDFRTVGKNSTNSSHMSFDESGILRADGWFVFIESTNRIWIFDGKSNLTVAERSDTGTEFVAKIKDNDAQTAAVCPAEVKKALPANVRGALFERHP